MQTTPSYPFAALVALDQLKTTLLLNAVYPAIGGVLIRGDKGTAKSTAARALREILPCIHAVKGCPFHCDPREPWPDCPHCTAATERTPIDMPVPFVDLPIGATEDRVLGTLDFERALREGRRAFEPGLLAQAHRGILYIDEVNLLPDHLVDVLLDAAAMGVNTVEREGVSVSHPARFLLVGTMNPEEGDLRPQLLDRFGLMVAVAAPHAIEERAEVVRRRLAFESDPSAFEAAWHAEQESLRERVVAAQALLPRVEVEAGLITFMCRLCCAMEVDGLRADLALHKTARALAAWNGRMTVTLDDIRAAAELVLPHRKRRKPFEKPGLDQQRLDELFNETATTASSDVPPSDPVDSEKETTEIDRGDNGNGERIEVFAPAPGHRVGRLEVTPPPATPMPTPGRRNHAASHPSGTYVRAVADPNGRADLAIDATVRAAARRGAWTDGTLAVEPVDYHRKQRVGKTGTLILFVVDASGSMAARRRMAAVKGAVLSLLQNAYEARDQVGVIAFRGVAAEVLLAPTRSFELAQERLRELPTGGRTPLAHALVLAHELLTKARQGHSELPILLVLVSDGKANVPLPEAPGDPWGQSLDAAARLAEARIPSLVLDSETGFVRLGRAPLLAQALGGECLALEQLSAEDLVLKVLAKTTLSGK